MEKASRESVAGRVVRVLEALGEPLLGLRTVDVRPEQCLVAGTAGHYDLERALLRVRVVPVRAQLHDRVVKMHADLAAHGHHHRLAILRLVAQLEVRHQVRRQAGDPRLGADQFFQRGPFRLQPGLDTLFLVLSELVDLVVDLGEHRLVQLQLGQPALVVDGHRRAIFLRLLHVVDVDVIAEHRAGVAVRTAHRGAGEGDEGRVGQRVAQVLRIAHLIAHPVFGRRQFGPLHIRLAAVVTGHQRTPATQGSFLHPRFETVLGAMRFVCNHHDVAPVRQQRKAVLILARHELLDGREYDPARRAHRKQLAQLLAAVRLHRLLAQQVVRQAEHAEQLAVEVVAVGDHHDGRVLHRRLLHHPRRKAGHRDALATALRVPHHAALLRTPWARRRHHLPDGRPHRVELVVAGDLLDQHPVVLEQHEEAQVIEQHRRRQRAAHQGLQFVELAERVEGVAVDGAPAHETLGISRQGTEARIGAIGHHQQAVVVKQLRNLRLVGLDLLERAPDIGMRIGRVLQLDQHQRQAIDEKHDVRPAGVLRAPHGELIDRQPFVGGGIVPVDQPREITPGFAVAGHIHRHPAHQQAVKAPVRTQQGRHPQVQHLTQGILAGRMRQRRVQPRKRRPQALHEHHLLIALTLGARAIGREVRAVQRRVTDLFQPAQGFAFEAVFGHCSSPVRMRFSATLM